MPFPQLAVTADHPKKQEAAARLAEQLNLPVIVDSATTTQYTHLLAFSNERLELRELGTHAPGPVYVDFAAGAVAHRRRFGGGRQQPLARAVGLKGQYVPKVIDATAGLGRDAFVLACLGCQVKLVERSPIIAALLHDGLQRAAHDAEIGQLVTERLQLHTANSQNYLASLAEAQRPDTVYLDPMYPHRSKSAQVGKGMRLLRLLVGDDLDTPALLHAALKATRRRVVVKRPQSAPTLTPLAPNFQIRIPNTRFDVYLRP
ncbi:MAG: 16S rRNA methyltransferase [Candidatus Contendobacter odensis]|uniref:Ribosomal RNA small subunit methyltransferase J n=1 Tax=Candidatus Contendibacter odensensis TaxID=1400860 RepID=A0A2G6PF48_9GAMM|nr:MAG: 16S rRNA methyltransferase [Candidatus Contendobacter odensis]